MKPNLIPGALVLVAMAAVTMTFQNCGPQGLLQYEQASVSDPGSTVDPVTFFDQRNDMKMMTGDQVYRSMSALSGVPPENAATTTAYNLASTTLADNFSLNAISSPLLLNVTNLGATFCDQAINSESAAGAVRKIFVGVNFAAAVSQLSGATYTTWIQAMSQQFWGRPLTSAEESILNQARADHVAAIAANQVTAVAQTRILALAICTAMISSNDSFTF